LGGVWRNRGSIYSFSNRFSFNTQKIFLFLFSHALFSLKSPVAGDGGQRWRHRRLWRFQPKSQSFFTSPHYLTVLNTFLKPQKFKSLTQRLDRRKIRRNSFSFFFGSASASLYLFRFSGVVCVSVCWTNNVGDIVSFDIVLGF
jgi:hypothetical protein